MTFVFKLNDVTPEPAEPLNTPYDCILEREKEKEREGVGWWKIEGDECRESEWIKEWGA